MIDFDTSYILTKRLSGNILLILNVKVSNSLYNGNKYVSIAESHLD